MSSTQQYFGDFELKDSTLLNINITPIFFQKIRKEISKKLQKRDGNGGENNDTSL